MRIGKLTNQSLVWIDATPYLEAQKAQCRKVAGKVETLSSQMEYYQQQDEPSYQRWIHSQFGEQLSKLRELSARHSELEHFVERVHTESFVRGISLKKAYERIMSFDKARETAQAMRDGRWSASDKFESENSFNTSETSQSSSDSSEFSNSSEFSSSSSPLHSFRLMRNFLPSSRTSCG